eukprot:UN08915
MEYQRIKYFIMDKISNTRFYPSEQEMKARYNKSKIWKIRSF